MKIIEVEYTRRTGTGLETLQRNKGVKEESTRWHTAVIGHNSNGSTAGKAHGNAPAARVRGAKANPAKRRAHQNGQ
jgi:hypothetical protein